MPETKMRIAVQYSTDGLFGATDPDEYDEKASVAQFGSSLENYLSEAYPNAEITVLHSINDSVRVNGMENHEEIPRIAQIGEKCWNGDDWLVGRTGNSPSASATAMAE